MKLHQRLFQLLVILLPTQLAFHFWPSWALVYGIRVDYFSPTIYLTDLLLIGVVLIWFKEEFGLIRSRDKTNKKKYVVVTLILIFAAANILGAQVWQVALMKWLKVLEMALLAFYVKNNWGKLKGQIATPLTIALGYSAVIAILQFSAQKTIGNPLYYLGERTFSSGTPGIALVDIFGRSFLRPYATFPHPNVLAGFALVSIGFLISNFSLKLILILILISFSQGAWIAGMVLLIVSQTKKMLQSSMLLKKVILVGLLIVFAISFTSPFLLNSQIVNVLPKEESVVRRLELAEVAVELFPNSPILGVGLGNFIVELPGSDTISPATTWWLQPVHNLYLLVLVETGVVGVFLFFWLLSKSLVITLNSKNFRLTLAIIAILLTGLFDHYWLTLQQTQLLLALVIGASFSRIDL